MFIGRRAKKAGCRIMAARGEDGVGAVMGRDLGGIWRDGRRPRMSGGRGALQAPAVSTLLAAPVRGRCLRRPAPP